MLLRKTALLPKEHCTRSPCACSPLACERERLPRSASRLEQIRDRVIPTTPGTQMGRPKGKIGEVLCVNVCSPCSYSRSRGTELALKGQARRAFRSLCLNFLLTTQLLVQEYLVSVEVFKYHTRAVGLHFGFSMKGDAERFHSLVLAHAIIGVYPKHGKAPELLADERQVVRAVGFMERQDSVLIARQGDGHPSVLAHWDILYHHK